MCPIPLPRGWTRRGPELEPLATPPHPVTGMRGCVPPVKIVKMVKKMKMVKMFWAYGLDEGVYTPMKMVKMVKIVKIVKMVWTAG